MKHHLLTAIIMALSLVPITSHAYDFSAVNDDGVTIYYNIISEEEKTCEVTAMEEGRYLNSGTYSDYIDIVNIPPYASGYKVIRIGYAAFMRCTQLTSVSIPNTVTEICDYAFNFCRNLSLVSFSNSIRAIGEFAFYETGLTSVTLPNSLESIGEAAFAGNELSEIFIPKTVINIGPWPFDATAERIIVEEGNPNYASPNDCNAIIDIKNKTLVLGCNKTIIPSDIEIIGDYAFAGCSFTSISIPESVTTIGDYAFTCCQDLLSITIPNSVESIGECAFMYCFGLTSIEIPNSVKVIDWCAFEGCLITTVKLGNSVETMELPFRFCTNIETVYSEIKEPFPTDAFRDCKNATLYVPFGMRETYRNTPGWDFKEIIEMEPVVQTTTLLLSCSGRGSVSINGSPSIANKISATDINEDTDNTFTFTPKSGCKLDQVILNGLDITANVEGNTLTCTIPANSQMIVTFATEQGDMNNDGTLDISDVVTIVNKILGN